MNINDYKILTQIVEEETIMTIYGTNNGETLQVRSGYWKETSEWKTSSTFPFFYIVEYETWVETYDNTIYAYGGNDILIGNYQADKLYGGDGNDYIEAGEENDTVSGGNGNDTVYGEDGNDYIYGGYGTDKIYGGDGNDTIWAGADNDTVYGGNDDDYIDGHYGDDFLNGGFGNDKLYGKYGNDRLYGMYGDDTLSGSYGDDTVSGGSGNDLLYGGYGSDLIYGGYNNDTVYGGYSNDTIYAGYGNDYLEGGDGDDLIYGSNGEDTLNGGDGNDTIDGGYDYDTLVQEGSSSSDTIKINSSTIEIVNQETDQFSNIEEIVVKGGSGDDSITNNGFTGLSVAAYEGKAEGYSVVYNQNGTWTVEDIDSSDGDEGTDTLSNIDQIIFNADSTRIGGELNRNTVYAVSGIHDEDTNTYHGVSGGDFGATNFIIDIEGETGLGLDFDTTKLANFINNISLPDQELENQRLATNLLLDAAGGAVSAVPVFGTIASTGIAMSQTLANYGFDLAQVEAQKQAAIDAVNNPDYDTSIWGEISQTYRDTIIIEDFQIGVDNLFLPFPSDNVGYMLKSGIYQGDSGVWIEAEVGNENSNLAFIVNNYHNKSNTEFYSEINNLLQGETTSSTDSDGETVTSFSSPGIVTFNQTPIDVSPSSTQQQFQEGTYASDLVYGEELNSSSFAGTIGSFELVGEFGDDVLIGNKGNDYLWGGFNTVYIPEFAAFTYEDDGTDILQGGQGDDILNGGTGDDILDGGGLIYDNNNTDYVTGVITNDGADTLTGGVGNDTFVFNTLSTGIDTITDFEVLIDTIQINQSEFGASSIDQFDFNEKKGALSFDNQHFATLEGSIEDFDVSRDIIFV